MMILMQKHHLTLRDDDRATLEQMLAAGFCDHVSHTFIGGVLKKPTQAAPHPDLVSRSNRRGLVSAFYAHLCAEDARALAERLAFMYTPKGAS